MSLFDYLKNIFLILLFIQFLPILLQGIHKQYTRYFEPKTQVGVLEIKNTLYDSTSCVKQLDRFFNDPDIKAILIKFDCSGSAAGTGQTIFNELLQLKKEHPKPVISLVENICASGGYWIACGTDYIIAPSPALIGSIGASFAYLFQLKEFIEQFKIKYASITAGAYKNAADPFTDLNPEQRALLQSVLDDTYQQFVHAVAQARKLPLTTTNDWADGKIFTGQQALKLGLIDEIGSMQNAIRVLKEKALIDGEIEWIYPPRDGGLWSLFTGHGSENDSMLASALNSMCTVLENRYANHAMH